MKKVFVASAIISAIVAVAQTSAQVVVTGPSKNPDETVCRTVADTGSRLSRTRVCRTRAEWEQQRRNTEQDVERAQTVRVERAY